MRRLPNTIALSLAVLTGAASAALAQGMASLPPPALNRRPLLRQLLRRLRRRTQTRVVAPAFRARRRSGNPQTGTATALIIHTRRERYRSQPWHQCDGEQRAQSGAAGRESLLPLFDNGPRAESRRQRDVSSPGPLIFASVTAQEPPSRRVPLGLLFAPKDRQCLIAAKIPEVVYAGPAVNAKLPPVSLAIPPKKVPCTLPFTAPFVNPNESFDPLVVAVNGTFLIFTAS